jgi:hypothetical protein
MQARLFQLKEHLSKKELATFLRESDMPAPDWEQSQQVLVLLYGKDL